MLHKLLQAFLRGESAPFTAFDLTELVDFSSSMSQAASLLEREVNNYWVAFYFHSQKEKDPHRTWKAMMLMWMRTVSSSTLMCHVFT